MPKNITINAELCRLFSEELSEKEMGILTKAMLLYVESGAKTDFNDRVLRIVFALITADIDKNEAIRNGNKQRQERFRSNHKNV